MHVSNHLILLLRPFKRHKKDIKIKYWYTFPQWAWIERPDLNIAPGNASHTQVDGTKTFFQMKRKVTITFNCSRKVFVIKNLKAFLTLLKTLDYITVFIKRDIKSSNNKCI